MESIKRLDWDSSFFGYEVGSFKIDKAENFEEKIFIEQARQYRLVYIYCKDDILNDQITLVDRKLTLWKSIYHHEFKDYLDPSILSFNIEDHNLDHLKDLTLLSGTHSRFYKDPNFTEQEYKALYLEWINKSVAKKMAFDTLIYKVKDRIGGFVTVSKKTKTLADIGLIAVDPDFRGKGIASLLIKAAIKTAHNKGFTEMQVVTQSINLPAVSLYKKANFTVRNCINIYHYWNL